MQRILHWLLAILMMTSTIARAATPDTVAVERVRLDQVLRLDAVVEAVHQSTLAAQTSGQIEAIYVDAGDLVPAGTELLRINDRNQRAEL
ncbi:MAG: biotin/lipoyl-binding protein, partial [Gammaproteobacteria bacterium]